MASKYFTCCLPSLLVGLRNLLTMHANGVDPVPDFNNCLCRDRLLLYMASECNFLACLIYYLFGYYRFAIIAYYLSFTILGKTWFQAFISCWSSNSSTYIPYVQSCLQCQNVNHVKNEHPTFKMIYKVIFEYKTFL